MSQGDKTLKKKNQIPQGKHFVTILISIYYAYRECDKNWMDSHSFLIAKKSRISSFSPISSFLNGKTNWKRGVANLKTKCQIAIKVRGIKQSTAIKLVNLILVAITDFKLRCILISTMQGSRVAKNLQRLFPIAIRQRIAMSFFSTGFIWSNYPLFDIAPQLDAQV